MKKYLIANRKGNKLIYDVEEMQQIIYCFPENRRVQITFELASERKTKEQLGYWFAGIVKGAAKHFGWEEDQMYEWLISSANKKPVVDKFTGEISYIAFGLSHCDKGELINVIEKAIQALAEQGYIVPMPNEQETT